MLFKILCNDCMRDNIVLDLGTSEFLSSLTNPSNICQHLSLMLSVNCFRHMTELKAFIALHFTSLKRLIEKY